MSSFSQALDVAIGMIFVFLLFSIVASSVQEFIATRLQWRSKDLLNAIQILLSKTGASDLYEHPIIKNLAPPNKNPSYIPAREFGIALFDLLRNAGTGKSPVKDALRQIKQGIEKFGDDSTRKALLALVEAIEDKEQSVEKQIASARASVEAWFDAAMDRVSGWYKRKAQVWAVVIGLGLAIVFNVDVIGLTRALWQDPALRQSASAAAVAYVERGEEANAEEAKKQLEELSLPIGWSLQQDDQDLTTPADPRKFPGTWQDLLLKILGLVLSGLAIGQGSPVWFDILGRVVNLRGAGKKPEPSGGAKP